MSSHKSHDLSVPQAIEKLFGIKLSQHENLKNKINSLLRNKLIVTREQLVVQRKSKEIAHDQLTTLHNAVILQALLTDPKNVKKVFDEPLYRQNMAKLFSALLLERRSIVDISLLKPEVERFLEVLGSTESLRDVKLANPFTTLPQVVLDGPIDLIQVILVQSASLGNGDAMMVYYLNGDLEAAWEASQQLQGKNKRLLQYKALIEREYREAKEFDELLDFLK